MVKMLVVAFYKFVSLDDCPSMRTSILECCEKNGVRGTILLAGEGINGTLAGAPGSVRAVVKFLRRDPRLHDLEHKESWAQSQPFYRMKVRLKREVVTLGVAGIDPNRHKGIYVAPRDWNTLVEDPDVVVIDARNEYEVAIGTFKGAINPHTDSFRELPDWLRAQTQLTPSTRAAMFCTGGIRCEKSTAYLRARGIEEVYHLQGGILSYLEEIPAAQSLWTGECFVFDERVSVGHGLEPGSYELCRACRRPISHADMAGDEYLAGVSCPYCHADKTAEQKRGFAERQKQMKLAGQRDEAHLGARPLSRRR